MPKKTPPRARCVFYSTEGTRIEMSGPIPGAMEMAFLCLDTPAQRLTMISRLEAMHAKMCEREQQI